VLHAELIVPSAVEIRVPAPVIVVHVGAVALLAGREFLQQDGLGGGGGVKGPDAAQTLVVDRMWAPFRMILAWGIVRSGIGQRRLQRRHHDPLLEPRIVDDVGLAAAGEDCAIEDRWFGRLADVDESTLTVEQALPAPGPHRGHRLAAASARTG